MLRLRRDDGIGKVEAPEVVIVKSHDGTSAYQMFAGMIRFVRTDSMVAADHFKEVRVPHKSGIEEQIVEGVHALAEDFPKLIEASALMKDTPLSVAERGSSRRRVWWRVSVRGRAPSHRIRSSRRAGAKTAARTSG
ncbi:hypothetical protein X739_32940 [Mesorhizobium sp. LNHC220B00]|nr:hypothetical protein X739_32940 [Mesorhizobium sp. LNHC220B00]